MKKIVISQPMFMPWRGMFEQIKLSDIFVFYDDVQLPRGGGKGRGFITRVQIKSADGIKWLSLPVKRSNQGMQLIQDAEFAHGDWRSQHLEHIRQCYRNAPFFERIFQSVILPIYNFETDSVSKFCMHSMRVMASSLGVSSDWKVSSRIERPGHTDPSQRVLDLCRIFQATHYITGLGALNYIDYDLFEDAGIRVEYMKYILNQYPQLHGAFNPYVSAIDLLFNVGGDASHHLGSSTLYWRDYLITEGNRPPETFDIAR
ncbi:MAG: WbqC family protein [Rhodocyclaceae bacterium]